jgi:ATP-dependent DNA ligase, homolog of eukaryotic ligase III
MSKYNRTYHLPWSPGTTSDDRIAKDFTNLLGREIVITEKLDGENCGFTTEGVYARSHATFTTSPWSRKVREIHETFIKNKLPQDVYMFGENMEGIHSIEYNSLDSYFYLFGVREDKTWLSWDDVNEYSLVYDLPTVPVLFRGVVNNHDELKSLTDKLVNQESFFGGMREGIVVRVTDSFIDDEFHKSALKWVRKDHVTTDSHWTRNWKPAKINKNYES